MSHTCVLQGTQYAAKREIFLILDKIESVGRVFVLVLMPGIPTSPHPGDKTWVIAGVRVFGRCGWAPFHAMTMQYTPHVQYQEENLSGHQIPATFYLRYRPLYVTARGQVVETM